MTPCPDDEITLSGDGEILIKCPECIMKGYYKNKTATDEVLINGVFHTGDLGKFDKDGNLYITGRKNILYLVFISFRIILLLKINCQSNRPRGSELGCPHAIP